MGDPQENLEMKVGVSEVKLLLDEAQRGNITIRKLQDIARKLGSAVLGNHMMRKNKGLDNFYDEMRDILTDWTMEKEFPELTRESALAKLIGILRHDDVNLNPLAWKLEEMLKEPKAFLSACSI